MTTRATRASSRSAARLRSIDCRRSSIACASETRENPDGILAADVTLAELAQRLRCRLAGDGAIDVMRVAGIEDAGPGEITFVANPKYLSKLSTTRASAAIVNESVTKAACALLHSPHPYLAFAEAVA